MDRAFLGGRFKLLTPTLLVIGLLSAFCFLLIPYEQSVFPGMCSFHLCCLIYWHHLFLFFLITLYFCKVGGYVPSFLSDFSLLFLLFFLS